MHRAYFDYPYKFPTVPSVSQILRQVEPFVRECFEPNCVIFHAEAALFFIPPVGDCKSLLVACQKSGEVASEYSRIVVH